MSYADRHKIIPCVYLILERDGQVLLGRRCNTGYEDGNYGLGAAGHAEAGETFTEAVLRETQEEIGITLEPAQVRQVLTMHRSRDGHERVDVFFAVTGEFAEPFINEPDKCDDLKWFAFDDLPENTIAHIRHALACYRNGVSYTEFGWGGP